MSLSAEVDGMAALAEGKWGVDIWSSAICTAVMLATTDRLSGT
jgi:hypothetical protein